MPTFGRRRDDVTYVDRPGAYGLIRREGLIALVKTSYGLFLPGGGIDPGETQLAALARELREEIDFTLVSARFLGSAAQYSWSQHYQSHFKKIGHFFEVEATAPGRPTLIPEHELVWLGLADGRRALVQEFHQFALTL